MSPSSHQVGPARICPAIMLAILNTLQSPLWTACETLNLETWHTLAMVLWKAVSAEVLLKEISQQMAELQEPPVNSSALEIAYWRSTHPEVKPTALWHTTPPSLSAPSNLLDVVFWRFFLLSKVPGSLSQRRA